MKHRILVLGAGYAGAITAGALAHRLRPEDFEITLVNAAPVFVQRLRLHQVATGQDVEAPALSDIFAGTGVRVRLAKVTAVDPASNTVAVTGENGDEEIPYDTLCYTLGSAAADHGVPGVAEHSFDSTGHSGALRLRDRLGGLGKGGKVMVVGEGLTGIETVTEIAESRPDLSVSLVARGEPGAWFSPAARRHLDETFDRLGVTVHDHTSIERVEQTQVVSTDGTAYGSDATVWAAGFSISPIAAAGGLEVVDDGRMAVDRTMRSLSHPNVYAAGDTVFAADNHGRPLPMSCASAGYTALQAAGSIAGRLTGQKIGMTKLTYFGNHISLGRKDGLIQLVDGRSHSLSRPVRGRKAARVKEGILRMTLWTVRHPTFGMPKRKHRLAAGRPGEKVSA